MSGGNRYVLDANVFIQAHQAHYSFDICPGFWLALNRQFTTKRVCSIDRIRAELVALNDPLQEWVQGRSPEGFFKKTADQKVIACFRDLASWVQNEVQFTPEAKAEFLSVADGWVVAHAKVNGLVVVTHEVYIPDVKKKVPIPNVCVEFDVAYCDTYEMLRDLKEQFVLRKRQRKK